MSSEPNYISVTEFVKEGYLQEANRQFFHPLGLALAYTIGTEHNMVLGLSSIWDYRDNPKGLTYTKRVIDNPVFQIKAKNILAKQKALYVSRQKLLGWVIQPVTASTKEGV